MSLWGVCVIMSDIEINEGNCVLSEEEIACIQVTFEEKFVTHGEFFAEELDQILLKIKKLNDLAKHEMLMDEGRKNDTDMATLLS